KTAETVWQAKKKCPDLLLLPPHHEKYREYHRKINAIFSSYTDQVEPFSIDESWLDVTHSQKLFGDGKTIADTIRERVKKELGLTLSAGVSFCKVFAKMGSEYRKPDATTVISRENYRELLWPLPVGELFFVGWATAQRLTNYGIRTIGNLAESSPLFLEKILGKQGPILRSYARGEEDSPVRRNSEREKIKSVGNGRTFSRNLSGEDEIRTAVTFLSDIVAGRLRKYQLRASSIKVDIKNPELKTISRQKPLPYATDLAEDLRGGAMDLIRTSYGFGRPIRLITVTAIHLSDGASEEQLSFFSEKAGPDPKSEAVENAMDRIRGKYGKGAIKFGGTFGQDTGFDM
ncbi:MAG: DNA polymerase IV, partial [Eubacteriales bacterium]|nr:DNA polymerase IV [Eubacteriales bacterium]